MIGGGTVRYCRFVKPVNPSELLSSARPRVSDLESRPAWLLAWRGRSGLAPQPTLSASKAPRASRSKVGDGVRGAIIEALRGSVRGVGRSVEWGSARVEDFQGAGDFVEPGGEVGSDFLGGLELED